MSLLLTLGDCTCGTLPLPCVPGGFQTCPCSGQTAGFQLCSEKGTRWGPCQCDSPTGNVSIDIATEPTNAVFSVQNMAPGDRVEKQLTVYNAGSSELRYAFVSAASENMLAAQLVMTVQLGREEECSQGDAVLYGPDVAGSISGVDVFGSVLMGHQAGNRILTAGAAELLCIFVELPLHTSNAYQGASTTLSFNLVAEQTLNNP
jgi:hypothetical protein